MTVHYQCIESRVRTHHTTIAGNGRMQAALKAWLKAKNL